jgi:PKD domain
VTLIARLLSVPPGPQLAGVRGRTFAVGLFGALALAAGIAAAPAEAVISEGFGQQRRLKAAAEPEPLQYHGGPVLHSSDSYAIYWDPVGTYRGDWRQQIDEYLRNVGAASGSLGDVFGVTGQYVDSHGYAANQSTFRGAYTDTDPYPTTENCTDAAKLACLTDQQLRTELQHVISSGTLPGATGPAVYYLLTPPGVTVCTDGGGTGNCSDSTAAPKTPPNGICGYHSAINPGGPSPIVYVVQPWVAGNAGFIESEEPLVTSGTSPDVLACQDNKGLQEPNQLSEATRNPFGGYAAGLADVIINDLSIEQSNVVVDPLLNGWYQTATNAEQADVCQWALGIPPKEAPKAKELTHAAELSDETINGHAYYTQWEFNSVGLTSGEKVTCWGGVALNPHFTAPNPVNAGDVVGFDASESHLTLRANRAGLPANEPYVAPIYRWDFGDGSVVSGTSPSQFHSYQYGGAYSVTLTVTDSGGNTASFADQVEVVGPPRPSAQGQAAPLGASAASGSAAGTAAGTTPGAGGRHTPVVRASVGSHSLRHALRGGLVVRYAVNEQVAGHFEVLIASSLAHRLGLHGATATGLARGMAPQTVIGRTILVTTKGGQSTIKLRFGKANAARLRRARKVPLMLRLFVRNASAGTATLLTSFSLFG